MLIVFTLSLYFAYLAEQNSVFISYLLAMLLFFSADMLSIVNILCVNNKIIGSKKEFRQSFPDGTTPMQGVSFLYNNPNSDKSTERVGEASESQSK